MGKNIKNFLNLFSLNDEDGYEDDLFDEDEDDEDYDEEEDGGPFSFSEIFGGSKSKKRKYDDDDDDDIYDDDDDDDDFFFKKKKQSTTDSDTSTYSPQKPQQTSSNKLVSFNNRSSKNNYNSRGSTVYVIKPQDFNEAQTVTEYLREGKAIVINLEGIDLTVAQRVIDFIGGSCFALDGSLQAISANIFIAAPQAVDVSGDLRSEILSENSVSPDLTKY